MPTIPVLGPALPPPCLRGTLYLFQRQGLAEMIAMKPQGGGLLADEMGLGKTATAIAYMLYDRYTACERGKVLVVAPPTLIHNWQREFGKWVWPGRLTVVYGHDSAEGGKPASELTREDIERADVLVVGDQAITAEYKVICPDEDGEVDPGEEVGSDSEEEEEEEEEQEEEEEEEEGPKNAKKPREPLILSTEWAT
ncbi:uncharacterized protein EI97DRAFT_69835 [Westerdykella ornata]|uniref:Helicase ATP-binding domain-containing protein n=1 Tax=Westerdykella ornata TaxID=318751 RepID=A0A6A6JIE2_WESOR|nr:uncharacterized protein EI97DRAFT_69835 [Westerdykella ornata]KAF2275698.1 hypothetical protein EI97DRAFT_69835 [Westerdykella ornata]